MGEGGGGVFLDMSGSYEKKDYDVSIQGKKDDCFTKTVSLRVFTNYFVCLVYFNDPNYLVIISANEQFNYLTAILLPSLFLLIAH